MIASITRSRKEVNVNFGFVRLGFWRELSDDFLESATKAERPFVELRSSGVLPEGKQQSLKLGEQKMAWELRWLTLV